MTLSFAALPVRGAAEAQISLHSASAKYSGCDGVSLDLPVSVFIYFFRSAIVLKAPYYKVYI